MFQTTNQVILNPLFCFGDPFSRNTQAANLRWRRNSRSGMGHCIIKIANYPTTVYPNSLSH